MKNADFSLKGKIALVTGASRGIGRALALALAKKGAHILALARDKKALEELDDKIQSLNASTTLISLDLISPGSVEECAQAIEKRWGKLDILVANAAILGSLIPITHMDELEFYNIFNLNLFSQWRLIRVMEPLLQKSEAGRVIILSSSVAHKARAYWGAYGASKASLEIIARCWAQETQHTNLRINIVNPGATRTDMRAKAMPGEDSSSLPTPESVANTILPLLAPDLLETGQIFDCRKNSFTPYPDP